jgi:hypothetical protein
MPGTSAIGFLEEKKVVGQILMTNRNSLVYVHVKFNSFFAEPTYLVI